jgi:fimbrial chaperone protein
VLGTAFLLICGTFPAEVLAQLAISPVRIDLSDARAKDVIRVKSQADSSRSYEVEVVGWSQSESEREIYAPTEDVIAVPPLFTLGPGEEQVLRLGMMAAADPDTEQAYRVFITELPPPNLDERQSSGVNMRLRIGIPVFVAAQAVASPELQNLGLEEIEGQLYMQVRNPGNTHVRISEIRYRGPGTDEPQVEATSIYILAGATGRIPVQMPGGGREGRVTLVTDTLGNVEYDLPASM